MVFLFQRVARGPNVAPWLTIRKYALFGKLVEDKMASKTRKKSKQGLLRSDVLNKKCPSRIVLEHATSLWGVLIFVVLLKGTHRFSEIRNRIEGISEKMLVQTLHILEEDGFIKRVSFPVVPPHVEYSLTPSGREVGKLVCKLAVWVEHHMAQQENA